MDILQVADYEISIVIWMFKMAAIMPIYAAMQFKVENGIFFILFYPLELDLYTKWRIQDGEWIYNFDMICYNIRKCRMLKLLFSGVWNLKVENSRLILFSIGVFDSCAVPIATHFFCKRSRLITFSKNFYPYVTLFVDETKL